MVFFKAFINKIHIRIALWYYCKKGYKPYTYDEKLIKEIGGLYWYKDDK